MLLYGGQSQPAGVSLQGFARQILAGRVDAQT
jgi:hypothetical protein